MPSAQRAGLPISCRFSSRSTSKPRSAANRAAVEPAGPAPTTTKSCFCRTEARGGTSPSTVKAPAGQAWIHSSQTLHCASSMTSLVSASSSAPEGQTLTHTPQQVHRSAGDPIISSHFHLALGARNKKGMPEGIPIPSSRLRILSMPVLPRRRASRCRPQLAQPWLSPEPLHRKSQPRGRISPQSTPQRP